MPVELQADSRATKPSSTARRRIASAVADGYGLILFIMWIAPLVTLASKAMGGSLWAMFATLGASAIFYFACLLSLPRRYYNLQSFEADGRLYRRLGVRQFRYVVGVGEGIQRVARWIDPNWQSLLVKKTTDEWLAWACMIEWAHVGFIFLSLPPIAILYYKGMSTAATLYLLSNIPFNVYPIMLQRYTRETLADSQARIEENLATNHFSRDGLHSSESLGFQSLNLFFQGVLLLMMASTMSSNVPIQATMAVISDFRRVVADCGYGSRRHRNFAEERPRFS